MDTFPRKQHHLHVALSSCNWQCKDGKKNANSGTFIVIKTLPGKVATTTLLR